MEAHYTPSTSRHSRSSFDAESDQKENHTALAQKRPLRAWLGAVWAPGVHCILSVAIVVAILVYVDGHFFNVTERSPLVRVVEGTRKAPFQLMQSDVVTILSAVIAASKWALAAWAASLCWHVALFLMERHGIEYRNFQVLLDYSLLAPGAYSKDISTWVMGALLMSCLSASFSSPLLTGSMTWIPKNQLARGLSIGPVQVDSMGSSGGAIETIKGFYNDKGMRENAATKGVGVAELAWAPGTNSGTFKRVLRRVGDLEVNSTIETVILPYFEVHSVRWIDNSEADNIPSFRESNITTISAPLFNSIPLALPACPQGCILLIPNTTTNWSSEPMEPAIIRDTRLMLFFHGHEVIEGPELDQSMMFYNLTQDFPPNTYQLTHDGMYFAFAWVTFTAGVGRCKDHQCIISSPSTIQNSTPIEPEPHHLTSQALSMTPIVQVDLVGQNTSLPYPWNDLNSYIEAVLVRSYSGAWNGLMVGLMPFYTNASYIPSFPGLQAQVDWRRVNIWLGIQLLATLLSAIFLMIQVKLSEYPLRGGTSLIGFYLDTTEIPTQDSAASDHKGIMKIELQGDRMKVKLG